MTEKDAPWRETPLDHWSSEIDPAVMVGDQWVAAGDPGVAKAATAENVPDPQKSAIRGRFQHPQHDVSYRSDV